MRRIFQKRLAVEGIFNLQGPERSSVECTQQSVCPGLEPIRKMALVSRRGFHGQDARAAEGRFQIGFY